MSPKMLLLLFAIGVSAGGHSWSHKRGGGGGSGGSSGSTVCTADVMQCPNGATVGRDPTNNCNFKPCPTAYTLTASINGTFSLISAATQGTFTGNFFPLNFSVLENQLVVTGTLSAVLTRTTRLLRVITQNIEAPVTLPLGLADILGNPGRRRLLQFWPNDTTTAPTTAPNTAPNTTTAPTTLPTATPSTSSQGSNGGGANTPQSCNLFHLPLQGAPDLSVLDFLFQTQPSFLDAVANPLGGSFGNFLCSLSGLFDGLGGLNDLLSGAGGAGGVPGISGLTQSADLLNSLMGVLNMGNLPVQSLSGLDSVTGILNSFTGLANLPVPV